MVSDQEFKTGFRVFSIFSQEKTVPFVFLFRSPHLKVEIITVRGKMEGLRLVIPVLYLYKFIASGHPVKNVLLGFGVSQLFDKKKLSIPFVFLFIHSFTACKS